MIGRDDQLIVQKLLEGEVVAFPTETVMGLGVVFDDEKAYQKLNELKGHRENKPYTLMLGDINEIEKYAFVDERSKKVIDKFMPGPITLLLKSKDTVPNYVTHNTGVVGIRVPDFPILLHILKMVNKPLLVPSANPSNKEPAKNVNQVTIYFNDTLAYIYDYNSLGNAPSTIVDLTNEQIKIVREGSISEKEILELVEEN